MKTERQIGFEVSSDDPASVVDAFVKFASDICPRVNMDVAEAIMVVMTAAVVLAKSHGTNVKSNEMFEWEPMQ